MLYYTDIDIHDSIAIIFGRSVTKKVRNQTMFCFFNLTYLVVLHYTAEQET